MNTWQAIRLLRSSPPGLADDDAERRAVFQAALEQSEQLMRASEALGYAARPLPLFYAVSQAGRAIAAAHLHGDAWRIAGHGLGEVRDKPGGSVALRRFKPQPAPQKWLDDGRRDAFGAVAKATGSGTLSGSDIALGEIWCAIPELLPPYVQQLTGLDDAWLRPLVVFDANWHSDEIHWRSLRSPLKLLVAGLPAGANADQLNSILERYPVAKGSGVQTHIGQAALGGAGEVLVGSSPHGQTCVNVIWSNIGSARIDEIAPQYGGVYRGMDVRLLKPTLSSGDYLSPLMLWWVLLFGLSTIARYDPETWVSELAVNDTSNAVAFETALDIAVQAVPDLIASALAP